MDRLLHNKEGFGRLLDLTSDTLILFNQNGICIDIESHSCLWFLQEDVLLGKNLLELLPAHTYQKAIIDFQLVFKGDKTISRNYRLQLHDNLYYANCKLIPFDGMILCRYRDITKRNNVKRQLEKTNEEMKEIQRIAQIGKWTFDVKRQILNSSGFASKEGDTELDSISYEQFLQLIVPEDKEKIKNWLNKNIQHLSKDFISYRIILHGYTYYHNIKCMMRYQNPDGTLILEGFVQDITDIQKRRNDINTLTNVIYNVKDLIIGINQDGSLIFANQQFCDLYHITGNKDIRSYKVYDLLATIKSKDAWIDWCLTMNNKVRVQFIDEHPLADNPNILAFEVKFYKSTEIRGDFSYWMFAQDISDRLHYESEIKRFGQLMDMILDNLPASITVKDINHDFNYLYCNREAINIRYSGSNAFKYMGKNDFDLRPIKKAAITHAEDLQVAETGVPFHRIVKHMDKNGNPVYWDKLKIKVSNPQFSPMIVNIEWNITQQELMKQEILAAKKKAEESDRLKTSFLANMSHEIRTPLNAIIGFSKIIANSNDSNERQEYFKIVDQSNERLLKLINEILNMSKIEAGSITLSMQTVNLQNLCQEVYDTYSFHCPEGVELINDSIDGQTYIYSDKAHIFQVYSSLIDNAFKFAKNGIIRIGFKDKGDKIECYVKDTGPGIPPDELKSIFRRFVKLNSNIEGTGLGLSICHSLIQLMGGKISVLSKVGKGSTFIFTLPKSNNENNISKTAKSVIDIQNKDLKADKQNPTQKSNIKKKTILIAENIDNHFMSIQTMLNEKYNLARAGDGIEAVHLFDQLRPNIVLINNKMPNMDGLEAAKIIHELSPNTPIIMQSESAYALEENKKNATEAGCIDFIIKPVSKEVLSQIINHYLK
jgi:signal transduction histidine kinase/CheY-like chemotaxis protein/PAS domain-containing protein